MKDLTPSHFRCALSKSCPAVHELADGKLLIVGRKITDAEWMEVHTQICEDENAIVIDRASPDISFIGTTTPMVICSTWACL